MFARNNAWNPDDDIPNLDGRIILVTGGYSGLGLETVRQLARHNPTRIYVAGRSQERGETAIRKLKETVTNTDLRFLHMDLTSFQSVKSAVESFQESESRLDLLVNNAGIVFAPPGLTSDGYEVQFGTNYMGHALLTRLLLPVLRATAKTKADVRVVTVSSGSEAYTGKTTYDFEQFRTTMGNESTHTRHCLSKLALIHFAAAAAQRYPEVKFITIHPGAVRTTVGKNWDVGTLFLLFIRTWILFFAARVEVGALNQLWASASPDAVSGEFYHPVGVPGKGSQISRDAELRERLWS
ncbi:Short-chain dehydrogenase/reductase like protein [Verticillium longisporum]|uniref:Short-chain dehydrogenase/reductase like protein n=2 Tax=Verticillium longisporum TaxID=100787 RepID=A0A8I2ZG84_VERLO|nr:Short-chain dehydrogenase/reductase like protein [Verticillium longisporum]